MKKHIHNPKKYPFCGIAVPEIISYFYDINYAFYPINKRKVPFTNPDI